jgi:hypothetical protein
MRCWLRFAGSTLVFVVTVAPGRDAHAIAYVAPYAAVINMPQTIPTDGLLAVGTVQFLGEISSQGELERVTFGSTDDVLGANSSFVVALGDSGVTQTISFWKPEQAFAVGPYAASSLDEYGVGQTTYFEVLDATASSATLDLEVASISVESVAVPQTQVSCGEALGLRGEAFPVSVTTHYGLVPVVTVELATTVPNVVLSQYFFRTYRPGKDEPPFMPLAFTSGTRMIGFQYAVPEAEYCVAAEAVSLATQGISTIVDAVCVPDDGTDWSVVTPATSEQIDSQLLLCPEAPEGFGPRYCALREDQGSIGVGCEEYTEEEIDEARDNPIVIDEAPPADPGPDVTPEPSGEPIEPSVAPTLDPEPTGSPPTDPVNAPAPEPVLEVDAEELPPSGDPLPEEDPSEPEPLAVENAQVDDGGSQVTAPSESEMSNPRANAASARDGGCGVSGVSGGLGRGPSWTWLLFAASVVVGMRRRLAVR